MCQDVGQGDLQGFEGLSVYEPGHQTDASASHHAQAAHFPSQGMAAVVAHSQALCPASFWREGLYITWCQHRPNGD